MLSNTFACQKRRTKIIDYDCHWNTFFIFQHFTVFRKFSKSIPKCRLFSVSLHHRGAKLFMLYDNSTLLIHLCVGWCGTCDSLSSCYKRIHRWMQRRWRKAGQPSQAFIITLDCTWWIGNLVSALFCAENTLVHLFCFNFLSDRTLIPYFTLCWYNTVSIC